MRYPRRLLGIATMLLLWSGPTSHLALAQAVFEQIDLCADGDYFTFDVQISGLQAAAILRMDADAVFGAVNAQVYTTNWDTTTGAFLLGPLVEEFGTPFADRWQIGANPYNDLQLLPGNVWRIAGAIRNGTQPLTSANTFREIFIRYFDGTFLDTRAEFLPIGTCNSFVFVDGFESGDTTFWSATNP